MDFKGLKNKLYFIHGSILWATIIFLSLWLSHNAVLYFTHGGDYGILPEKTVARQDFFWNICFYIHLPAGILCLFIPVYSFARRTFNLTKNHAVIGKIYQYITIYVVCPTGIYLALYAKGGLITQIGFIMQGVLLAAFTNNAVMAIKRGDTATHVEHMVRSYAVATVVLTFRVLHILFFYLAVPYMQNYAISQWLGMSVNLLLAEAILYISYQHKLSNTLKIKSL